MKHPHNFHSISEAATYIMDILSRFIEVNTLFIAKNDHIDNTILKAYNRSEILVEEGTKLPLMETYCHLVFNDTSKPLIITNTADDPSTSCLLISKELGACSFIGVPIITPDNHSFGTICAMDRRAYSFNQDEISLLEAMAKFIAYVSQMENLLLRDSLTNTYNRNYLKQYASGIDAHQDVTALFLDLDDFKRVNDTYGHAAGDYVLTQTADRLQRNLNSPDALIRMGGDEFLIFIHSNKNIDNLTTKLLELIREPIAYDNRMIRITASIGISYYNSQSDIDSLIRNADQAMYKVKQTGKNHYLSAENKMT